MKVYIHIYKYSTVCGSFVPSFRFFEFDEVIC